MSSECKSPVFRTQQMLHNCNYFMLSEGTAPLLSISLNLRKSFFGEYQVRLTGAYDSEKKGAQSALLRKDKVKFWPTKVEGIRSSDKSINTLGHISPKTFLWSQRLSCSWPVFQNPFLCLSSLQPFKGQVSYTWPSSKSVLLTGVRMLGTPSLLWP